MKQTPNLIFTTALIILTLVLTIAYFNPRYDLTLFLTAIAASLTSNLIFELVLRTRIEDPINRFD